MGFVVPGLRLAVLLALLTTLKTLESIVKLAY